MQTSGSSPVSQPSRFASHFIESVLLTWVGNLGRIVIGLVALRLVTSAIPEAALGGYWILTSVSGLLANFADLGIGLGVVRHLPLVESRDAARRLMHTALALRASVLVLLCVLIFACRPWVLRIFNAEALAESYVYLYAFVILNNLAEIYTNFLQGQNRFRFIAGLALLSSVARLVLIVAFVRGLGLGVRGLFLAEATASVLQIVVAAILSGHGLRPQADRTVAREQLRFGFPLYLNTLLSYTAVRINTVLIGGMSNTAAVSYFTVAGRVPDQLQFVLRSYVFVYLPSMSRLLSQPDRAPARRLLAASLRLMSFCFAMLAVGMSFFRHELLRFLAPESYQVAAPAVPLLLGGLTFASLGMILGNTFVALGDSKTPVRINFWTSLLGVALNVVCIRTWGFMGAAWAQLIFNVVAYAITDAVLSRRMPPESRSYLLTLALLGGVLAAGLQAGVAARLGLLAAGVLLALGTSRGLRQDVGHVWNAQVAPRLTALRRRGAA